MTTVRTESNPGRVVNVIMGAPCSLLMACRGPLMEECALAVPFKSLLGKVKIGSRIWWLRNLTHV